MPLHSLSFRALAKPLFLLGLWCGTGTAWGNPGDYDTGSLTGDWGGARQQMADRGWLWEIGYRTDLMAVVKGSQGRAGPPASHLDVKLRMDLEKIVNWHGTTAYVNLIDNRGGRPNADRLGSLTGITSIEVPVPTSRIFHAWVQQEWGEGQLSVLFGLYPIDSEFMVLDSAGIFVQPAYGALADLALSVGPSIFNNSAVGVRARWLSSDRSIYVQGALLDGIPGDPSHAVGTHIRFGRGDGTMGIAELGFRPVTAGTLPVPPDKDQDSAEAMESDADHAEGGFGKFAVGLWRYSSPSNDLVDTDDAGNPLRHGRWGWYGLAEKTVAAGTPLGDMAVFGRYSGNDGRTIPLSRSLNVGAAFKGPYVSRPDDSAGVGYTRVTVAEKYRTALQAEGVVPAKRENVWEVTYRVQVNPWLALQPVMQYFQYPGGDRDRSARVIGLRLDLVL